jgi:hypothetical protein
MVGATKLLYFQINDLSLETRFKSGKAASESGIIAARYTAFCLNHVKPGTSPHLYPRAPPTTERENR